MAFNRRRPDPEGRADYQPGVLKSSINVDNSENDRRLHSPNAAAEARATRSSRENRSVRARAARPFYPQVQTSSACPGMSVWCQNQTRAPQQASLVQLSRGSVVTSGFAPNYQIQSASVRSPLAPSPPLGWRPYAVRHGDSRGIHRGTLARKSSYWAPNF